MMKKGKLDKAIDELRIKFGSGVVYRSCFLGLAPVSGGVIEDFQMMSSLL